MRQSNGKTHRWTIWNAKASPYNFATDELAWKSLKDLPYILQLFLKYSSFWLLLYISLTSEGQVTLELNAKMNYSVLCLSWESPSKKRSIHYFFHASFAYCGAVQVESQQEFAKVSKAFFFTSTFLKKKVFRKCISRDFSEKNNCRPSSLANELDMLVFALSYLVEIVMNFPSFKRKISSLTMSIPAY